MGNSNDVFAMLEKARDAARAKAPSKAGKGETLVGTHGVFEVVTVTMAVKKGSTETKDVDFIRLKGARNSVNVPGCKAALDNPKDFFAAVMALAGVIAKRAD